MFPMTFPFDGELIYLTIQDEEAAAAKTQFEAKAAVDIQRLGAFFVPSIREEFNSKSSVANFKCKPFFRKLLGLLTCYFTKCIYYRIFRGYVARNVYKKLLRDERERLEDERKAAVEIQRYNLDFYSYTQEDREKLLYTYGFKGDNFQICCIFILSSQEIQGSSHQEKGDLSANRS